MLVDYSKSFFPVILIVFLLRSFLVEPFKIPSGSMLPTLLIGDFILVNKYEYGIRLPVINKKVIELGSRSMATSWCSAIPSDPSLDYIKRVIGLPGDVVEYVDKRLSINGQPVSYSRGRQIRTMSQRPELRRGRNLARKTGRAPPISP
jgi:signal peptidase I